MILPLMIGFYVLIEGTTLLYICFVLVALLVYLFYCIPIPPTAFFLPASLDTSFEPSFSTLFFSLISHSSFSPCSLPKDSLAYTTLTHVHTRVSMPKSGSDAISLSVLFQSLPEQRGLSSPPLSSRHFSFLAFLPFFCLQPSHPSILSPHHPAPSLPAPFPFPNSPPPINLPKSTTIPFPSADDRCLAKTAAAPAMPRQYKQQRHQHISTTLQWWVRPSASWALWRQRYTETRIRRGKSSCVGLDC